MERTKEQYESLINNSLILSMCKTDETESEFDSEFRKFTLYLYEYSESFIYKRGALAEFGVEFMKTVKSCLNGYDSSRQDFVQYFISSISNTIRIAKTKQKIKNVRNGSKVGRNIDGICRSIFRYASARGIDVMDEDVQKKIAQKLNLSLKDVQKAIEINYTLVPVSNVLINDDGEEIDLFDYVMDKSASVEASIIENDNLMELVDNIETAFLSSRNDTQKAVGYKLTAALIKAVDGDEEQLHEIRRRVSFFADEILTYYRREGKIPTDKQLADMIGVNPASFSRTLTNFKNKLNLNK